MRSTIRAESMRNIAQLVTEELRTEELRISIDAQTA
jgi:hypothetical protein